MSFQETDRVWIRHFLGYSALFLQADPRLENAITSIQAVAENGQRPDASSENFVKGLLYGTAAVHVPCPPNGSTISSGVTPGPTAQNVTFATPATQGLIEIEKQLQATWGFAFAAGKQSTATVDPVRGVSLLRSEGRRLAASIARMLGLNSVRADMFSPGQPIVADDPFTASSKQDWL